MAHAEHAPYPKFRNDLGVGEIRIGAKEFECVGAAPPHDHPHIYLDMGDENSCVCPYCGTHYIFTPSLKPYEALPADCSFSS